MVNLASEPMFTRIQNEIRQLILRQNLQPGDMLPPASQLAAEWGVSLASFREAVRALEAIGVLETRHGSGTYIREFSLGPIFQSISFCLAFRRKDLTDLLQARRALETGLLGEVMERISDDNLMRLEAIAQQIEILDDQLDLDYAFHKTLFECLDNTIVTGLIDMTWVIYHHFWHRVDVPELMLRRSAGPHAQLVRALRAHDLGEATRVWREHFDEGGFVSGDGDLRQMPETAEHR